MIHALKEKSGPAPKKGVTPNMFIARCGVEEKFPNSMTAWESIVDCEACLAARTG